MPPASSARLSPAAFALLAASSLTVMANATIAPSLPAIADQFRGTPGIVTLVGLLMTLPSLAVALSAFGMGVAADRFGRRKVLLIGLALYGVFGSTGLWMSGLSELLVGRFALGLSVAALMTASTALIGDLFTGPERDRFMGIQGAAMSLGGVVFLLAGGALAEWQWRAPFALYLAAFGVLALVLVAVPAPVAGAARPVATGPQRIPLGLLLGLMTLAALSMAAFYMIPVKLPFLLRELGHDKPIIAGLSVAACTLASMATALNYGRLRQVMSPPAVFALAFFAMAVGYSIVGFAAGLVGVIIGVMVAGLGLGLLMPNQAGWLLAHTPPAKRGTAAGLLTMAVFIGQFVSPLISGPLSGVIGLPATYQTVGVALALLALVMLVLASRDTAKR